MSHTLPENGLICRIWDAYGLYTLYISRVYPGCIQGVSWMHHWFIYRCIWVDWDLSRVQPVGASRRGVSGQTEDLQHLQEIKVPGCVRHTPRYILSTSLDTQQIHNGCTLDTLQNHTGQGAKRVVKVQGIITLYIIVHAFIIQLISMCMITRFNQCL